MPRGGSLPSLLQLSDQNAVAPAKSSVSGPHLTALSEGLEVRANNLGDVMRQTEGASPAFIRELLRRAALFAIERRGPDGGPDPRVVVDDQDLGDALQELAAGGEALTGKLLGMQSPDLSDAG